jgi:hypothetical protein
LNLMEMAVRLWEASLANHFSPAIFDKEAYGNSWPEPKEHIITPPSGLFIEKLKRYGFVTSMGPQRCHYLKLPPAAMDPKLFYLTQTFCFLKTRTTWFLLLLFCFICLFIFFKSFQAGSGVVCL